MRPAGRLWDWVERNAVILAIAGGPMVLIGFPLIQGRVFVWGTPSMQFIPWWTEACRQLAQGHLPLWNSLNGLGAPLMANYQSAFFYPPNWALLLFGFLAGAQGIALGFSTLALLHLIWAGLGMAALLRRCGASRLAQSVGGLAFALGGYLVARLEFFSMVWTASWLPWMILTASALAAPVGAVVPIRRFRFSIPLALSIGMMLLAGHAQLSWYGLLLAGVWVLAGSVRAGLKVSVWPLLSLAAAGLAGGLLAAVQLVPTAEFLLLSQRSAEYGYAEAMTYSFWPWRFLTLLAPDFFGNPGMGDYWGYASFWEDAVYIGIVPLLLALSTLGGLWSRSRPYMRGPRKGIMVSLREGFTTKHSRFGILLHRKSTDAKQDRFAKPAAARNDTWSGRFLVGFLWITVLIAFVFALGKNTPVYPFLYRSVPTFDMFQAPARYLLWAVFGLALLSAVGADGWNCPQGRGLYWLRLGTAGAFAVTVGAGLAWLVFQTIEATFIRATALAGLWALGAGVLTLLKPVFNRRGKLPAWSVLVVIWMTADLLAAGWWVNPVVEASFYAGSEPQIAKLKSTLGGQRVYMPARVEYLQKFRRFFRASDYRPVGPWRDLRAVLLPNLNLIDGVAMVNNFDPLLPERYARWIQALEQIPFDKRAAWLERAGAGVLVQIDVAQPGGVRFERLNPQRRYAIYACADWVMDGDEALRRYSQAAQDSARIFIEGSVNQANCEPAILGWAEPAVLQAGNMEFSISISAPGWLLVDESWYPGWRAEVDRAPAEILRANYLFMAVPVPQGEHKIRLRYRPDSFTLGFFLSILGLVLLSSFAIWRNHQPLPGNQAGPG